MTSSGASIRASPISVTSRNLSFCSNGPPLPISVVGVGLEGIVLTATVLGGITLGGGRGSVTKSAVGTLIVLLITNGLTTMNARGGFNRMALASILLIAATVDIRWQKNRARIISKVYVIPTFH